MGGGIMPAHKRFPDRLRVTVYMDKTDRKKIGAVSESLRLSISQFMLLAASQVADDEVAWREAARRRNQVLRHRMPEQSPPHDQHNHE